MSDTKKINYKEINYREKSLGVLTSSTAVANYIIQKNIVAKNPITTLRLQKITYIIYAFYLSFFKGERLFFERIQAWQYGTVIPSIYHTFKHYGCNGINELAKIYEDCPGEEGIKEYIPVIPENMKNERLLFDFVWDKYMQYSSAELVKLTHMEGSPWYATTEFLKKEHKGSDISDNDLIMKHRPKIPDSVIKRYYDGIIEQFDIIKQFKLPFQIV